MYNTKYIYRQCISLQGYDVTEAENSMNRKKITEKNNS